LATPEKALLMPVFKISEDIQKYSAELVRLPFTFITDCPKCQSNSYKGGTCTDCGYKDPTYLATVQSWQQAQMAQRQVGQKAATKQAFTEYLPELRTQTVKCPRCNQNTFEIPDTGKKVKKQDWYKNGGECSNPKCNFSKPPKGLGFNSKDFAGIDNEWLKSIGGIRQNFKPIMTFAASKIEKNINILKKSAPQQAVDPGAFLDNSMTVSLDKTTRMNNMLQTNAQLESQSKQQQQYDGNAETSEEQQ
jgi:ribosomal protein L37E